MFACDRIVPADVADFADFAAQVAPGIMPAGSSFRVTAAVFVLAIDVPANM